jgi:exodeoxyribonuclease VII small subunit
MKSKDKEISFEEAMVMLEDIVQQLESGDAPLEKAIELFQDGMKMAHLCSGKLELVEKKIEILIEENGSFVKKPFAAGDLKGELDI